MIILCSCTLNVTGNCTSIINAFKKFLDDKFKIKDFGILHYFFGIETIPTSDGICFNQRKYAIELISEFGLTASKLALVPMDQGSKLNDVASGSDHFLIKSDVYQHRVGKLIYLTLTRPDISFVVYVLSQFMHAPKQSHFSAALKVLKHLKGNLSLGIGFFF